MAARVEGQRIDKIAFDKNAKVMRYSIGNRVYHYDIRSQTTFVKDEIVDTSDIINAQDINDTYSLVMPSPYSMDRIGIRGTNSITIIKGDDDTLVYGLDNSIISILRAVVDGSNIFIVTENSILRTDVNLQNIETIGTFLNPGGLLVINKKNTVTKVAATIAKTKGSILLYKYSKDSVLGSRDIMEIHAHENNIRNIAISRDGKFVATASDCGTNVKVFSTDTGNLYKEFRRGLISRNILNLSFDWKGHVLACISDSGSVHFFDLYAEEKNRSSSLLGMMSFVLPDSITKMQWSSLPSCLVVTPTTRMECSFSKSGVYHIVTYEGVYYKIIPMKNFVSDAYLLKVE